MVYQDDGPGAGFTAGLGASVAKIEALVGTARTLVEPGSASADRLEHLLELIEDRTTELHDRLHALHAVTVAAQETTGPATPTAPFTSIERDNDQPIDADVETGRVG